MKHITFALTTLLLAPPATLRAADALKVGASSANEEVQVSVYYFPNLGPVEHSEWRSIKAATPKFEGHAQPKVPVWDYENETASRDGTQIRGGG